jgi:hypothetical protein
VGEGGGTLSLVGISVHPQPRHDSRPAGPVDITRLRWRAKRALLEVLNHRAAPSNHARGTGPIRAVIATIGPSPFVEQEIGDHPNLDHRRRSRLGTPWEANGGRLQASELWLVMLGSAFLREERAKVGQHKLHPPAKRTRASLPTRIFSLEWRGHGVSAWVRTG